MNNLSYLETFYTINPFFDDLDKILELTDSEAESYYKYDKYKLSFGENFEEWVVNVVIHNEICTFLWFPFWNNSGGKNIDYYNVLKVIKCLCKLFKTYIKSYANLYPINIGQMNWVNYIKIIANTSIF